MGSLFLKLFSIGMTAGYLILAVLLLRLLFRKAPKWIFGLLWGMAGLRLMLPVSVRSIFSLIPSAKPIITDPAGSLPAVHSGIAVIDRAADTVIAAAPEQTANRFAVLTEIAGIVWLIGLSGMLCYALVSVLRIRLRVREAVPTEKGVYVCDEVRSPFILGIFRPKIYLPPDIDTQTGHYILAHERAHIRRGDHLWKPLGFLLLSVYWFHPLVWAGYLCLCRDIEMACDEKVIKTLQKDGIADYSEALLRFSAPRRLITACPLAFGEVGVGARIRALLHYKKPAFWVILLALVAAAVTALCLLTDPKEEKEAITEPASSETTLESADDPASETVPILTDEPDFEGTRTENGLILDVSSVSKRMETALRAAITDNGDLHYKDRRIPHEFSTCAYAIFYVREDEQSADVGLWFSYMSFGKQNGDIKRTGWASLPCIVTLDTSTPGAYRALDLRIPEDGEKFEKNLRALFPEEVHSSVLAYWEKAGELDDRCVKAAKEYFGISDPEPGVSCHVPDPEKLSLTVVAADFTPGGESVTVAWENCGDGDVEFGLSYCVWREANGRYECLPENDAVAVDLVMYGLKPGGRHEIVYDLSMFDLEEGEIYRLYLDSFTPGDYWVDFAVGAQDALSEAVLRAKYPGYFDLKTHFKGMRTKDGLSVLIWPTAADQYRTALVSTQSLTYTGDAAVNFSFLSGASIPEMRAILETYDLPRDMIDVVPICNPLSGYLYLVELSTDYQCKMTALFWGDESR